MGISARRECSWQAAQFNKSLNVKQINPKARKYPQMINIFIHDNQYVATLNTLCNTKMNYDCLLVSEEVQCDSSGEMQRE